MKLVLDTNVLLSAVLVPGTCRTLLREHALLHTWYTSPVLLAEFGQKLSAKLELDPEKTPMYLMYQKKAILVDPPPLSNPISRDPDDDHVLALALAAQADFIIT